MASGAAKAALFDALSSVARALGNGRRAEIVDVLAQGERSVDELAVEISQSVANTSQHLQVLARAGLVRSRRDGTRVFYRLASDRVGDLWAAVRDVAVRHVAEVSVLADDYLGERCRARHGCGARGAAGARRRRRARRPAGAGVPGRAHRRRSLSSAFGSSPRGRRAAAAARDRRLLPRAVLRLRRRRRPPAAGAGPEGAPARRRVSRSGGGQGCRSRSPS